MKRKIASAVVATMLATSCSYVWAQPGPPGQQHGNGSQGPQRGNGPPGPPRGDGLSGQDHGRPGPQKKDSHDHDRHDYGKGRPPGHSKGDDRDRHQAYRGDPPPERWHKGQRVPQPYRGYQYVVEDWRPYHLHQPPHGYQWISVGPDFFLIGVATGVVLESVFGN
ncbi:RcnB family protein [Bordetella genomosp. 11]|nr:RcnB family protein [Bordetella genomosp. 11]